MPATDVIYAVRSANIPNEDEFEAWAQVTLAAHHPEAELNIKIVDEQESQELNHQYRGMDKPTNVLSFPCSLPEGVDIPYIGDIAICADVVEREAVEQNKTPKSHWAHMLVHAILHLLGYDHIDDAQAEEMESLETKIMLDLGFAAPYECSE
ncbi:MAG: rRNA maturation RNase YbeY [Alteromonadaceae bacterium]|nr:MAG: rRNA maturation RNase YbeY [Alteromonadaceae bacterium]